MRIYDCVQGSEEWERIRKGRPTGSQFGKIVTPKQLKLSAQSMPYAIKLAAERLGVETPSRMPSQQMMDGTEREPYARMEYAEINGVEVDEVGFCVPDYTDLWGMSPDGLIGLAGNRCDGLLEIKCPEVETLIQYHLDGLLPSDYTAQVQGQLWISGAEWCDFFAWHPEIEPFQLRVYPDVKYHEALEKALPAFVSMVDGIFAKVKKRDVFGIDFSGVQNG